MLEALKFVQRGVARREIVPGLTHFRIKDRRCTGFNGAYALSAPVDIGFDVAPAAVPFIKALNECEDVITLRMEGKDLMVRSGGFRNSVQCVDISQIPESQPEGVMVPVHASILSALETLQPFIAVDASRAWATGVLLANQSAYATNNVIVAEYFMETPFPHVINIPSSVVDEVVRVHEELTALQISESNVTFHYADGRWIKSQLLDLTWPNVPSVLDQTWSAPVLRPVPETLLRACEKLERLGEKGEAKIFFRGTDISTKKEGAVEGGAVFELPDLPKEGVYFAKYLIDVLEAADDIDFSKYPGPVPFCCGRLRGAIMGIVG